MRKTPPRICFFSKVKDKKISLEGPYEEKFLTTIESWYWEQVKAKKRLKNLLLRTK